MEYCHSIVFLWTQKTLARETLQWTELCSSIISVIHFVEEEKWLEVRAHIEFGQVTDDLAGF